MTHPFLEPRGGFAGRWALVKRGGTSIGNRPLCRMAWLVSRHKDGSAFRGQVMGANMTNPTKHAVEIEARDVVAVWIVQPSPKAIRAEKKKLKPVASLGAGVGF